MSCCPVDRFPRLGSLGLAVVLGVALGVPAARAGDQLPFVYGLNEVGQLSVNSTILEKLPGFFKPGDGSADANGEQRWMDLLVDGNDRYALRLDGRVERNGEKLRTLPFVIAETGPTRAWLTLHRSGGVLYALRSDGVVAADDVVGEPLPLDSSAFIDLATAPAVDPGEEAEDVYVLRLDGAVFRDQDDKPGFDLDGGVGFAGAPDGSTPDTYWLQIETDPVTGEFVAFRADGKVVRFDPADYEQAPDEGEGGDPGAGDGEEPIIPPPGEPEATLAFGGLQSQNLYVALSFAESGCWYALQATGRIFSSDELPEDPFEVAEEIVDLPGPGGDSNRFFTDLAIVGDDFFSIRWNGEVFRGTDTERLFKIKNNGYTEIVVSAEPPVAGDFKNRKPVAAVYKLKILENEAVTIPVHVTDTDKASEDLELTVDLEKLPGGVWDPEARTVTFPGSPSKGGFKFKVFVDDGVRKRPKRYTYKINVKPQDTKPEKNKPPLPGKIKKIQAIAGKELVLPILASDRDGDPVTILPKDPGEGIFALGAAFDEDTDTLSWTPGFDDLGKHKVKFEVSDNDPEKPKTKKVKLKIEVVSQLVFADPEDAGE